MREGRHPSYKLLIQFVVVARSHPTVCDAMDCSLPGFTVLCYFPEFAQIHVHQVSDTIQPSHPLSPPSLPAPNPSQHQGLFQWVSSSHQLAKLLEFQLQHQHQSFQWIIRTDFLEDWLVWFPCNPRGLKSLLQHHSSKASILRCWVLHSPTLTSIYDHWKNHSLD